MKNSHLYPILNLFLIIVVVSLLALTAIPISPLMITVVVATMLVANFVYHHFQSQLDRNKVLEIVLAAFIVQLLALSFL